jgi:serine/threonine protein kinase
VDIESLSPEDPRSLGRYELLGRLGRGSQGVVFLARDPANGNQQVAVKLLRAHLDGDDAARSRFLREVEAAKRVARFCTAQVLDANVQGTQPYVVSEYIPGPSLQAVIRSGGPRVSGALDRIAVNTATALGAIHTAGIVHRDFKAANVLMGPDGPVVIDFGVAKALGSVERQVTLTGQQVGTPAYMAPEQFHDGPAGPEADIFAWGATMVFAATGTLPFGDGAIPAVMYRILNEQPDLGNLNGPMRDLVWACLDKNPAARPAARQIVDHLTGAAGPMPMAPPPGPPSAFPMQNGSGSRTGPGNHTGPTSPMPASVSQTGAGPGTSTGTGTGTGTGQAGYTIDPLHNVSMRQNSASSVATGAPPLMPAGGATVRSGLRRRPHISRAMLIAAAVIIVVAGGSVVGLKAFTSPSPSHNTAGNTLTAGTPSSGTSPSPATTSKAKSKPKTKTKSTPAASHTGSSTGSSSHGGSPSPSKSSSATVVSTGSGVDGSTAVNHYTATSSMTTGNLAEAGTVDGIPYFEPASGDYDWLGDVHHCEIIGSDGTTEGIICLDLLADNPGSGTTYYAPVLSAFCQTISTGDETECANITADFGMFSSTGTQETPELYGWCGHSDSNMCGSDRNYFVDTTHSSWMSVSTAAANSCKNSGGEGTDCEMYPYAYSGVNIELPGSDKHVLSGTYTGADAIGY